MCGVRLFEHYHKERPLQSTDSIPKETPTLPAMNDSLVANAGSASSATTRKRRRSKKFLSYYKPYIGLFFADMACAFIVSAITLILPLCARYITKNVLEGNTPNALNQIYMMGAVMLALVVVHTVCNMFVDYQGHMMGAMMESDMRSELFEHYQKLSFSFYDEQRTGQLMTRITNDSFALSELYHHGPEDIVISSVEFCRRVHYPDQYQCRAYLDRLSLFASHGCLCVLFQ